ncbi:MAG: hypothetical protein MJ248_07155 [Bacilli bacterium]|nr:hypothetical protein [Bacilli bacterium]
MAKVKRKIASSDFLESQLPQTRKDQFKDILKINFWLFVKMGAILLLIFSLMLVKNYFTYFFNAAFNAAYKNGELTLEDKNASMVYLLIGSGAINLILYPPIFIVISGLLRIIRQLCYGEGIIFSYDYKMGVKTNWKSFLVIGLLFALFELLDIVLFAFFGFNFLTIIVVVLSLLVIFPTLITSTYFLSVYQNKLGRGLINSLFIHLRSAWKSVLVTILLVLPVLLLEFLWNSPLKLFVYLILILIGLPILLLFGFEIYLSIFDEHVNIYHFPEAIRKGLYISEKEKEEIKKKIEKLKENSNEKKTN